MMKLRILLPNEVFFDGEVTKVVAEAENGSFCLLPLHVDVVTALTPGLLTCRLADGRDCYFAVDGGVLVKQRTEVLVSVGRAVRSVQLGALRDTVTKDFQKVSNEEQQARAAIARLETALARRFIEFRKHG